MVSMRVTIGRAAMDCDRAGILSAISAAFSRTPEDYPSRREASHALVENFPAIAMPCQDHEPFTRTYSVFNGCELN
jgi:hypothetical protein